MALLVKKLGDRGLNGPVIIIIIIIFFAASLTLQDTD